MSEDEDAARRRAELTEQADYHVQAFERRSAQESVDAQGLIDEFVATATRSGLATDELMARAWSGRGRYRTGVVGWYLRHDESIGVGRDGAFYVLVVAPQRFGRRSVALTPTPPPLNPGQGARDGESATLEVLLGLRLEWSD